MSHRRNFQAIASLKVVTSDGLAHALFRFVHCQVVLLDEQVSQQLVDLLVVLSNRQVVRHLEEEVLVDIFVDVVLVEEEGRNRVELRTVLTHAGVALLLSGEHITQVVANGALDGLLLVFIYHSHMLARVQLLASEILCPVKGQHMILAVELTLRFLHLTLLAAYLRGVTNGEYCLQFVLLLIVLSNVLVDLVLAHAQSF